jgi:broad specificity phosphatase PhoE
MPHLYFFRHGETDYNREKRLQGQCDRSASPGILDMPLNKKGVAQAHQVAAWMAQSEILLDVVLSSPLARAIQTGHIVSDVLGVPVQTDDGLKEMFFGAAWEGMLLSDFKAQIFSPPHQVINRDTGQTVQIEIGAQLRDWHKLTDSAWDDLCHPGGETKAAVQYRARAAIEKWMVAHPDQKHIGIVSHNALMRFLLTGIDPVAASRNFGHAEIIVVATSDKWKILDRLNLEDDGGSDSQ